MAEDQNSQPTHAARAMVLRLLAFLFLVLLLHLGIDWTMEMAAKSAHADMLTLGLVIGLLAAYALLIAVPFVPGIEIGFSLLALRGAEIAPALYLATLAGLMIAYFAGRHLPLAWVSARLSDLRLSRAAAFVAEVAALSPESRLALLRDRVPGRVAPFLLRWRYLFLAALVNMPGSGLIGGGGGICLVAGLTGIFGPKATALTLALAVAPVPILVWWAGLDPGGLLNRL